MQGYGDYLLISSCHQKCVGGGGGEKCSTNMLNVVCTLKVCGKNSVEMCSDSESLTVMQ